MSKSRTIYRLLGVVKNYGSRQVLKVDELEIQKGEIFACIGPSGAGKSTLLRLLNFLEPPTEGSILFGGFESSPGEQVPIGLRRRVTMVFQRPTLLDRSVWDNVAYGLRLRGQRNQAQRIDAALDEVGLVDLAGQPAKKLSGGEAQRVALARAMVLNPDVLLLDEPTANLDPYNVGLIEGIIRHFNQNLDVTVVLVTHNIFQAKRLAQRVMFLLEGNVIEVGQAEGIFNSPGDARTRAFISGEMVY